MCIAHGHRQYAVKAWGGVGAGWRGTIRGKWGTSVIVSIIKKKCLLLCCAHTLLPGSAHPALTPYDSSTCWTQPSLLVFIHKRESACPSPHPRSVTRGRQRDSEGCSQLFPRRQKSSLSFVLKGPAGLCECAGCCAEAPKCSCALVQGLVGQLPVLF